MMKSDLCITLILIIMVTVLLVGAGCMENPTNTPAQVSLATTALPTSVIVQADSPAAPATVTGATKEEMVAFVNEAVAYAKANGKDKALAVFSDRNGSFFRGELYIYAYDYNGTTIAHPVSPEKIGVNRLDEKDAAGNLFIRELRDAATNSTGFVTYYYINPVHNNTLEKKLGYAVIIDPDWWIGSGIYLGPGDDSLSAHGTIRRVNGTVLPPDPR